MFRMSKMFFLWISMVLFAGAAQADENGGPEIGKSCPNVVGRTLDERVYTLRNDKGAPKVLNFFSVDCKACKDEMPELARLEKRFPGVKFIAAHTEPAELSEVAAFIQKLAGAPSNVVVTAGDLQKTFKYLGLPHTVLLDANNIVLQNFVGYTPENMVALESALAKFPKK